MKKVNLRMVDRKVGSQDFSSKDLLARIIVDVKCISFIEFLYVLYALPSFISMLQTKYSYLPFINEIGEHVLKVRVKFSWQKNISSNLNYKE